MASTPPDIGQPTREARTGREDRGQHGNKWWTLVAVCLGTFMLLLDITIVNVALPDIQRALHSSFADLQWVVDAYALTLASFLLTAGSLADMYGRRVLYLIGLAVFTGASALCGFATSTLMLQLSRGVRTGAGHTRKGNLSEPHPNRAARQARAALGPGDRPGSLPGRYDVLGLLRG